tara:strand:+ start:8585 stop:9493 length:909 start_codon:yes stop_codon:yes gene_type:complete
MVKLFRGIFTVILVLSFTHLYGQEAPDLGKILENVLQKHYGNTSLDTLESMNARSVPIELEAFELEDKRNLDKNCIFNNVMSYTTKPFSGKWGRPTDVHETVHGINNALSNIKSGYRAFYVGEGKAIWIQEPNVTMDDIVPLIPEELRGYRFPLYFLEQKKHWNDVALYPLEEWCAYIAGAECAVDDYSRYNIDPTKYKSHPYDSATAIRTDEVSGSLEFAIYCTALAMAVSRKDKEYWKNHTQFKRAMKFFLVKAEKIFFEGKDIFKSEKQDKLLNALQNSSEGVNIRNFLRTSFDGVFLE